MVKNSQILLVRNAYDFDFGGGERYPVNLAIELKKNGVDTVVASRHPKIENLAMQHSLTFRKMPWLKYQNYSGIHTLLFPLFLVWQARLIVWYLIAIKKLRVDIIHPQSRDDFIAGTIAAKLSRKKIIWTDHADLKYIYVNTDRPFRNPTGKLVKYCSRYADKIIVVSKNELRLITESLGARQLSDKYTVIYNGVDDAGIRKKPGNSHETVTFVATSRLVYSKGISELIEATKRLKSEGQNIKTILLGEGPDSNAFKKVADDSIEFRGFPDDYLSTVSSCDVFVHPSYNEGFSLSLVEAAMLGMPVIATKVGGNPEIIIDKRTGILIPPKNAEKLYEAMQYALKNSASLERYATNLRKSYEECFQFDRIVREQIIPLYNSEYR